jgi:hypothetical protein
MAVAGLGSFLLSVLQHWVSLLAGCGATVVLELFRRYWLKREISLKWHSILLLLFVLFACYQAWLHEHSSAEGRAKRIVALEQEKASLQAVFHEKDRRLEDRQREVETLNSRLQEVTVKGMAGIALPTQLPVSRFPTSQRQVPSTDPSSPWIESPKHLEVRMFWTDNSVWHGASAARSGLPSGWRPVSCRLGGATPSTAG